eukprot:Awhi_evm1s3142
MDHKKLKWHIFCATFPESRLVRQVQILKSHFEVPEEALKTGKLASGTHGLRSELSSQNNGSNICVCWKLDKEESEDHFLLECP